MTDLNTLLAEVEAREQAATKGTWALDQMGMFIFGLDMEMIASEDAETANILIRGAGRGLPMEANATFIAHARQDIPKLLRLVRVLMENLEGDHATLCPFDEEEAPDIQNCNCNYSKRITAAIRAAISGGEK